MTPRVSIKTRSVLKKPKNLLRMQRFTRCVAIQFKTQIRATNLKQRAPVAQLDRAPDYGSGG